MSATGEYNPEPLTGLRKFEKKFDCKFCLSFDFGPKRRDHARKTRNDKPKANTVFLSMKQSLNKINYITFNFMKCSRNNFVS